MKLVPHLTSFVAVAFTALLLSSILRFILKDKVPKE